jgi:hypothetical protein
MGWHYTLHLTCKILPEYKEFISKEYLRLFYEPDLVEFGSPPKDKSNTKLYMELSKDYRDLIDSWIMLDIANFYEYTFENNIFHCQISKKVTRHSSELIKDYELFLRDIIVPISSEIITCTIESDDFGCHSRVYTDTELRGKNFILNDMIKTIEHTFNEDRTEIYETRIVYKRAIKELQFLDLDRAFKTTK